MVAAAAEILEWWKLRLRKRWEQRWLWKYWKRWKLRLHRQWRMLDGGVLQRPVVDHPVPGRKIRVQDGITETKRRAGGCASPCLLHIGQEPGRKTAGEKEEGLYEQKESRTDGWHRASYGGRGGAGNGPGGYGICDGGQFKLPGGKIHRQRSSGNGTQGDEDPAGIGRRNLEPGDGQRKRVLCGQPVSEQPGAVQCPGWEVSRTGP